MASRRSKALCKGQLSFDFMKEGTGPTHEPSAKIFSFSRAKHKHLSNKKKQKAEEAFRSLARRAETLNWEDIKEG